MPVYFIQAGEDGPIKIGFTNGSLKRRLDNLKLGSHQRLSLIASMEGDAMTERALHERISSSRLMGEWFEASQELLALCNQHSIKPPPLGDSPNLRALRKHLGLTQAELAAALDVSRKTIIDREAGRVPTSRETELAMLYLLAENGLAVDVDLPEAVARPPEGSRANR